MIAWRPAFGAEAGEREPGLPPFATELGADAVSRFARELPALLATAAVIAFVLKTFIAQAFYIPSPSMVPQLQIDDRVVVSKLAYRTHDPRRGDIVVFDCPPRANCASAAPSSNPVARVLRAVGEGVGIVQPSTEEYIKRIIGLPGEQVEGREGVVWIDGQRLAEPYVVEGTVTSDFGPLVVPAGTVWVMGDNRTNSSDSRFFGPVDQRSVVGRALLKVWPATRPSFL